MPKQGLHNDKSNRPLNQVGGISLGLTPNGNQWLLTEGEAVFSRYEPLFGILITSVIKYFITFKSVCPFMFMCVCVCTSVCTGEWAHMPNCVCRDQRTVHKSFILWVPGIEFRSSEFCGTDFYPLSYLTGWIIFLFIDMNTPIKYICYQNVFNKLFNYFCS